MYLEKLKKQLTLLMQQKQTAATQKAIQEKQQHIQSLAFIGNMNSVMVADSLIETLLFRYERQIRD
jgi:hypothetical protein